MPANDETCSGDMESDLISLLPFEKARMEAQAADSQTTTPTLAYDEGQEEESQDLSDDYPEETAAEKPSAEEPSAEEPEAEDLEEEGPEEKREQIRDKVEQMTKAEIQDRLRNLKMRVTGGTPESICCRYQIAGQHGLHAHNNVQDLTHDQEPSCVHPARDKFGSLKDHKLSTGAWCVQHQKRSWQRVLLACTLLLCKRTPLLRLTGTRRWPEKGGQMRSPVLTRLWKVTQGPSRPGA